MKIMISATAAALVLAAGPALAQSCAERISQLEVRLEEAAEVTISTSTGGQGVAGAREGQAQEADRHDIPVGKPAVPYQQPEQEAEAIAEAEDVGGGIPVMEAKARLNEARAFDEQGNAAACEEAVAEVEQQLEPD